MDKAAAAHCRGYSVLEADEDGYHPVEFPGNGVFPDVNQVTQMAHIIDGSSQTILVGERPSDPDACWGWWAAGTGVDDLGLGDHVLDVSDGLYQGVPGDYFDLLHYWSMHSGGAYFVMCDGSVRFVSYSIDHETFLALGSRNGGEVVSGF